MMRPITAQERIASRYIPAGYKEYRRDGNTVVYVSETGKSGIAFRGTAMNADWHTTYTTIEAFERAITAFFDRQDEIRKWKETRKATRQHGETDTQKVKKALKAAGYNVTSVHRDTGTASNWISITIDDYRDVINERGDMTDRYGNVLWIAQVASGRENCHDDIQSDYFEVNINVNFTKNHKCAECVISNCDKYHTPEMGACGGFLNQAMADIHYAIWSAPVLPPYINPEKYLFAEVI